jgi:hypothetical protein
MLEWIVAAGIQKRRKNHVERMLMLEFDVTKMMKVQIKFLVVCIEASGRKKCMVVAVSL